MRIYTIGRYRFASRGADTFIGWENTEESAKLLEEYAQQIREEVRRKGLRESVTIDQALELLNSALAADPKAVQELVGARVLCNERLADHPTIQVASDEGKPAQRRVGLLGILNGFFGIRDSDGFGAIHAECKDDGTIVAFARTSGAEPKENPPNSRFGKTNQGLCIDEACRALRNAYAHGEEAEMATRGVGRFTNTDAGILKELEEARNESLKALSLINRILDSADIP